jgi:quercetin dioxygenase-like cupin family protein
MRHATLPMAAGVTIAMCMAGGAAFAADSSMALYPNPAALKWSPAPPVVPNGAQITVLSGDPNNTGPFVIRLKLPANYAIPAHHHPTAENVTVLSGTLYAGMGDILDRSASKPLAAGGSASLPAQMNHFAFTKAPTVIQVEAEGPFTILYVNPADDPSKTH